MTEKLIRNENSIFRFQYVLTQKTNHGQHETIDFLGNFEFEHAQFY